MFDQVFTLAFSGVTQKPEATAEEIRAALISRIMDLNDDEIIEACGDGDDLQVCSEIPLFHVEHRLSKKGHVFPPHIRLDFPSVSIWLMEDSYHIRNNATGSVARCALNGRVALGQVKETPFGLMWNGSSRLGLQQIAVRNGVLMAPHDRHLATVPTADVGRFLDGKAAPLLEEDVPQWWYDPVKVGFSRRDARGIRRPGILSPQNLDKIPAYFHAFLEKGDSSALESVRVMTFGDLARECGYYQFQMHAHKEAA